MNKVIYDKFSINDNKSKTYVKGHVKVTNDMGEVILEKDNLVLMNTRVFLFEHLFREAPPSGYLNDSEMGNNGQATNVSSDEDYNESTDSYMEKRHKKFINAFMVGSGGADVNSEPFNPFVPKFNDTKLANPVFFKQLNTNNSQSNGSVVPTVEDLNNYVNQNTHFSKYYRCTPSDNREDSITGTESYYAKTIEEKRWEIDKSTGEVKYHMTMRIENDECRGTFINEIGLVLARYKDLPDDAGDDIAREMLNDWELATRLTFDSESLMDSTKGLTIDYYMYI